MSELRRIAACDGCGRQFRVDRRAPGERFRCSCGRLVTVPEVRPHDAAVIHCSACGAPRQAGAAACGFCGGDFTLHDRDLDTICPRCMARLSRGSRYCHHCATPITAGDDAGTPTELSCPACAAPAGGAGEPAPRLASRRAAPGAPLTLFECGRCAGMWIEREVFRLLAQDARRGEVPAPSPLIPVEAEPSSGSPRLEEVVYRPCPECGKLMHRQNYGRKSGVILDVCRDHGLWFDAHELDRVLRWLERGGAERAERLAHEEVRQRRRVPATGGGRLETPDWSWEAETWRESPLVTALWWVVELVESFLADRAWK
jgi:Zn-finger nucleic acid-binding protein